MEENGWDGTRNAIKDIQWIVSANPSERTKQAKLPDEEGNPVEITLHLDQTAPKRRLLRQGTKRRNVLKGPLHSKKRNNDRKRSKNNASRWRWPSDPSQTQQEILVRETLDPIVSGQLLIGAMQRAMIGLSKTSSSTDLYFHADLLSPSCSLNGERVSKSIHSQTHCSLMA